MQRFQKFLSQTEPTLHAFIFFISKGKRILNTHFGEAIITGFGILATPGNHICEIVVLCDYYPEWQVHFIMPANLIDQWWLLRGLQRSIGWLHLFPAGKRADRLVTSALGAKMRSGGTCTQYLPKWIEFQNERRNFSWLWYCRQIN